MAEDAIAFHDEGSDASRLPEVNVGPEPPSASIMFFTGVYFLLAAHVPANPCGLDVKKDLPRSGGMHRCLGHQYPVVRRHLKRGVRVARQDGAMLFSGPDVCLRGRRS